MSTNSVICADCASVVRDHDSAHLSIQRGIEVFSAWLGLNRDGHHAEVGAKVNRTGTMCCALTRHTFTAKPLAPAFALSLA